MVRWREINGNKYIISRLRWGWKERGEAGCVGYETLALNFSLKTTHIDGRKKRGKVWTKTNTKLIPPNKGVLSESTFPGRLGSFKYCRWGVVGWGGKRLLR